MRTGLVILTVAVGLVLTTLGGGAVEAAQNDSDPTDARWLPWLGCWQLWQEQFGQADQLQNDDSIVGRTSVCVTPSGDGIDLIASVGDRTLVERRMVADGAKREVLEDGCEGWERSEWSRDGQRLFTRAELQCRDTPTRRVIGVSLMASPSSWVDIQLVELGDRQQLEVRRYSPVSGDKAERLLGSASALPYEPSQVRQARREATEELALADVMEVSEKTAPRVVEAVLVETEPDLRVNGKSLIALDDAGIDHGVIDLLVALSYPDHFVVEQRDRGGMWSSNVPSGFGSFGRYDPIWYDSLYPYYVMPYGARSFGGGYARYLYGATATPFLVLPATGGSGEQTSDARAYNGRGYTRVRPRVAGQVVGRGTGASSGSSGRRGTATTGGYRGGGASTASSGGGGGGGGRSGTGRTAVSRPQ